MNQLSPKQTRIYEFILSFTEQNGYPPSVREIADAVGLKSPSTVHFHLKSLEEAGVIGKDGKEADIVVKVSPEKLPLVTSAFVDGHRCLVIPLEEDEQAFINGEEREL